MTHVDYIMFTRQEGGEEERRSRGEHFTSIDRLQPGQVASPTGAEALRAEKVKHATEYWKHAVSHMTNAKTQRSEFSSD